MVVRILFLSCLYVLQHLVASEVCGSTDKVPCVTLSGGVRMPLVALGTGASSFERECVDPGPHPPFKNMSCYKAQAEKAAKSWLQLGGSMLEMAQIDQNMIPVSQAISAIGVPRENVFLETKCFGSPNFDATVMCGYDALQMLNTSYIDLLLLHLPYRFKPQCWDFLESGMHAGCDPPAYDPGRQGRQEAWRALELLVQQKKVRAIGLSDFSVQQIEDILEIATVPPAVLETHWAPGQHNSTLHAFCSKHNIVIQAWGALGAGNWGKSILASPELERIADAHSNASRNVSTAQVALRWSVQLGNALIAGTGNPNHMRSDMNIFDFVLDDAEMDVISSLKPGSEQIGPIQIQV